MRNFLGGTLHFISTTLISAMPYLGVTLSRPSSTGWRNYLGRKFKNLIYQRGSELLHHISTRPMRRKGHRPLPHFQLRGSLSLAFPKPYDYGLNPMGNLSVTFANRRIIIRFKGRMATSRPNTDLRKGIKGRTQTLRNGTYMASKGNSYVSILV